MKLTEFNEVSYSEQSDDSRGWLDINDIKIYLFFSFYIKQTHMAAI